jgi:hypothetical protein
MLDVPATRIAIRIVQTGSMSLLTATSKPSANQWTVRDKNPDGLAKCYRDSDDMSPAFDQLRCRSVASQS